jgi:hypothetical protein
VRPKRGRLPKLVLFAAGWREESRKAWTPPTSGFGVWRSTSARFPLRKDCIAPGRRCPMAPLGGVVGVRGSLGTD